MTSMSQFRRNRNFTDLSVHELFMQAMSLHRQGRLVDAEVAFNEVLRREPKHFDALHFLGLIAIQTKRAQRGTDLLKKAIKINPNVAVIYNNLGTGLAVLKRLDEALVSFDKAIALEPNYIEAHKNRGNVLRDMKRFDEAQASYNRVTALRSEEQSIYKEFQQALPLYQQGKFTELESICKRVIERIPTHFDAQHLLGVIAIQARQMERGIHFLEKAISLRPAVAEPYCNLGKALGVLNRFEEALASYEKAIALQPNYAEAYYSRGNTLANLNRYAEALTSYDKAIALNPTYAPAFNNRGNLLSDLGRFEDAILNFDQAIALQPDFSQAYNNRGTALSQLRRYEDAVSSFKMAISYSPINANAHNNLGNVFYEVKRHKDAITSYDNALATEPQFAEAWVGRGNAFSALELFDEAVRSYENAVKLKPELQDGWVGRGRMLSLLRRYADAIENYEQAIERSGDSEVFRYNLAALGVGLPPGRMPREMVVKLFDEYADRFDKHLIGTLKYRAPAMLFGLSKRILPPGTLNVLDLGCGTGLVGAQFSPIARTLIGVDISENMLQKARARGVYTDLILDDVTHFLQSRRDEFDLVVSADLFIYIGDLSSVFSEIRCALKTNGLFCFSVEAAEKGDFVLRSTLRYAHSLAYLRHLADSAGFNVELVMPGIIRNESEVGIDGYYIAMRPVEH
jgi:predicted TPR repeat methyltransferase/lipoprotein NlpI